MEQMFYIIYLDTAALISRLPPKSKRDFNDLFGVKHDPTTGAPVFGISPLGMY